MSSSAVASDASRNSTPNSAASRRSPSPSDKSHDSSLSLSESSPGDSNAAKESFRLLDLLDEVKNASLALAEFKAKHGASVKAGGIKQLEVVIESLDWVHSAGVRQAGKVSNVKYLRKSHQYAKAAGRKRKANDPMQRKVGLIHGLRVFNKRCRTEQEEEKSDAPPPQFLFYDDNRRSARVSSPETIDDRIKDFSGLPPQGATTWTRETLFLFMDNLVDSKVELRPFLDKILGKKRSPYTDTSGMYKMYKRTKSNGGLARGPGRPSKVDLDEIVKKTQTQLKDRSSDSSTFKLKHMKNIIVQKQKDVAAAGGLDPDTIECSVTTAQAKICMTATAATASGVSFSRKKLLKKTSSRYRSEHSIMCGYAYAATALTTMYLTGPQPRWLRTLRPDMLSPSTNKTLDMVKRLHRSEEVYPVNPNLVLSTDDTTVFVFEGTKDNDGEEEWDWKIIDMSNNSSLRSDFEVGSDAENSGGLRVRLTFTFTASGLAAPPYVSVSGLTEEELSVELCPDGILACKVPGLCKGGDDLHNNGYGWLVFLRADRRDKNSPGLSIANKKFIHYNDDVLLPFIQGLRERLGLRPGQEIPEWMTAVSWFDGDIPQLQTMLYEAREAIDAAERIIRNKHSAAATGTQQPCDLSPVFRLLKYIQSRVTAVDDTAVGLVDTIDELFKYQLRAGGLNLDGNPRKKKGLRDFLRCIPETLEKIQTKDNLRLAFAAAGMIDRETMTFPNFDGLMGTCKRWVSSSKDIGVSLDMKRHCEAQFQELGERQMEEGQISYSDMRAVGIPLDINEKGETIEQDRPSGAHAEHLQGAKTINAEAQQKKRADKRRLELTRKANEAQVKHNVVSKILQNNAEVEAKLTAQVDSNMLADATIALFLRLTVPELQDFIHVRKFTGHQFLKGKLTPGGKTLKKTLYAGQTAESIGNDCNEESPCLVWLAYSLRTTDLVLKANVVPDTDTGLSLPDFAVTYATRLNKKCPSEYLKSKDWVEAMKLTVKGVSFIDVDEEMVDRAKWLVLAMQQRIELHVDERVDKRRHHHYTLDFLMDNIPALAAGKCLTDHIVENVQSFRMDECLLKIPNDDTSDGPFKLISNGMAETMLGKLEGSYLVFDRLKRKWVRSGMTAGEAMATCFSGRIKKHTQNARSVKEMRQHPFYQEYPAKGAENIGGNMGKHWEDLMVFCGAAFDRHGDNGPLFNSLYEWSKQTTDNLKGLDGSLENNKLRAVAYLWELCDDLLLAKADNVSRSPGFEGLGLSIYK